MSELRPWFVWLVFKLPWPFIKLGFWTSETRVGTKIMQGVWVKGVMVAMRYANSN